MNPIGDDENPGDFDELGEPDSGSIPASDDYSGIDMPEERSTGPSDESSILEPVARKDSRASSISEIEQPRESKLSSPRTKGPLVAGLATVIVAGLGFAAWNFWPPATGTPVTGTPVTGTPVTGTPVTGTPVTGTPGPGTPGPGTPGPETPGTETPSIGIAALGTPGAGTPETLSVPANVDQVFSKMAEDASASRDSIKAEIQALEEKGQISEQDRQRLQTIKDAIELLDRNLPTPKRKNDSAPREAPDNANNIRVDDGRRYASLLGVNLQAESSAQRTAVTEVKLLLEPVCELLKKGIEEYGDANFVDALDSCYRAEFYLSESLRSGTSPLEKQFLEKIWELKSSCIDEIMAETSSSVANAQRSAGEAMNSATSAATSATGAKQSEANAETSSTNAEEYAKDAVDSADSAKGLVDSANASATRASEAAALAEKAAAGALEERDRQSIRSTLAVKGSGAEFLKRLQALMPSVDVPAANKDAQFPGPSQDEYVSFEKLIKSLTPAETETIDSVLQSLNGEQLRNSALEMELLQRQLSRWEQGHSEMRVRNLIAAMPATPGSATPGTGGPAIDMRAVVKQAEAAGKKAADDAVATLNVDAKIESRIKTDVIPKIETVSNDLMTAKVGFQEKIANLASQGISSEKQLAIESNVVTAVLKRLYGEDGIPGLPGDETMPPGAAGDYFGRGSEAFFSPGCPDYIAAKRYFGLAARIKPRDPVYRYFLAATLHILGETDEAKLQARAGSLLEQKMTSSRKSEIGARLEKLQGIPRQWLQHIRLTSAFGS